MAIVLQTAGGVMISTDQQRTGAKKAHRLFNAILTLFGTLGVFLIVANAQRVLSEAFGNKIAALGICFYVTGGMMYAGACLMKNESYGYRWMWAFLGVTIFAVGDTLFNYAPMIHNLLQYQ